jgi:hypothetical protein
MTDFDWITARSGCSLVQMFLKLKRDLQEDLLIAKPLFRESGRIFNLNENATSLTVFEEAIPPRGISFELNDSTSAILVKDLKGTQKFAIAITLNEERECVFVVDGEELESWQVRRKALESLFFSVKNTLRNSP